MNNDLKAIDLLCQVADAIIKTPSLSLSDFGIVKNPKKKQLMYTKGVSAEAVGLFPNIVNRVIASAGTNVVVESGILAGIGLIAPLPILGIGQLAIKMLFNQKRKREQQEKERVLREIIRKQQATIQKQKEVNVELEKMIRAQQSENEQLKEEIARLRKDCSNLQELLETLVEQMNQFGDAA